VLGCEVSKVKSLVFQARTALIERRTARETSCAEIRQQLATLRGGALRRSHLRHHLEACPGCSEYREEIRHQRAMLAIALPVVPTAALRANVLGGLGIGGGSAAAGTTVAAGAAGGGLSMAAPGGLVKLGIVAALAAGGAGGATVANNGHLPLIGNAPAHESSSHHRGAMAGTSAAHTGTTAASGHATAGHAQPHKTKTSHRSAKGTAHGFTPTTGQSNGAAARDFAKTRGKGSETSATRRHATAHTRAHPAKPVRPKHVVAPKRVTPVAPTHTNTTPAPKAQEPATAPQTTTTAPVPQSTQTTPAPPPADSGITKGAAGKTQSGSRSTAAG